MAYTFQVSVDCADPRTLADWWADVLGWQVEDSNEEFIRLMIKQGQASEADTMMHNGKLVWKEGTAIHHPEGIQHAPRLLFQLVPEGKTVKNRMHLDVHLGPGDDMAAVADRLTSKGARVLHHAQQGPYSWITLTDPEGNEFCITA